MRYLCCCKCPNNVGKVLRIERSKVMIYNRFLCHRVEECGMEYLYCCIGTHNVGKSLRLEIEIPQVTVRNDFVCHFAKQARMEYF